MFVIQREDGKLRILGQCRCTLPRVYEASRKKVYMARLCRDTLYYIYIIIMVYKK